MSDEPARRRFRCEATIESRYADGTAPMTISCEVEAWDETEAQAKFKDNTIELMLAYLESDVAPMGEILATPIDAPPSPRR